MLIQEKEQYIDKILDDNQHMLCDIYIITNIVTNKQYVGQANTHRLNNGKYRPFGYQRRLKDHISEAICNTKKKQCTYLNNSIRKHGEDNFKVQLLERCLPENANATEIKYISEKSTLYPSGYNLSLGGRKGCSILEHRQVAMENTRKQFESQKLLKYKNTQVNPNNLDQYIHERRSDGSIYYCVIVDGIKSIFVGKYMDPKDIKQLAYNFLKKISEHDFAT